jgi:phospholipid-translocating ATPase
VVVYTGKETRMAMNSREPREKRGSLDEELNVLSKYIFAAMVVGAVLMVLPSGSKENSIVLIFKFILLTCCVIPISLRINLDFSKILFSYRISNDPNIEGSLARNSEIPEELGRVQFILSDKTGTLTQNEMIFKYLCLEQIQFKDDDIEDMKRRLKFECQKEKGPLSDVFRRLAEGKGKNFKRDTDKMVRDMLTAIAVCHNVTPVVEESGKSYQASSPDEVALVKLAETVGMTLEFRDQKSMKIKNILGQIENFEILENFPFSSDTKRMGILVRHVETNRLIFYLKGADTAIISKVPEIQKGFLLDECENLAREGLRTLVITQKALSEDEYVSWKKRYHTAQISSNRAQNTRECIDVLEQNMDFLGITGVEDKLQEEVRISIEQIRNAGINFWMLTGDKIETAMCIAISTAMKTPQQDFFVIRVKIGNKGNQGTDGLGERVE